VQGSDGTSGDAAIGRISELARAEASARGLAVLEVGIAGGRPPVVAVTVDVDVPDHGRIEAGGRPRDAVDIDVIAGLSRALDTALVEAGIVSEDATLEVSSPGVERPLVTAQDLVRNLGRDVEVAADGATVRGRLVAVEDGSVALLVDGSERLLELERVEAARLVLPW
jgi:ribosome maturation factor RimP